MMRVVAFVALSGLVASCAPVSPPAPAPSDAPDQCLASQHSNLIGKNRSEIPATPAGATWRVTCTTCPVTMDYSPERLNIFFNQQTGIIEQVRCG